MNKIAKDGMGNVIGYDEEDRMIQIAGNEIFVYSPHQSAEFKAEYVFEAGEWVQLDGNVFYHPESEWVRTEEPTI